jgi:hypothetical protein
LAWIELHQNLLKHPKLIRLAAQLSVEKQDAFWHLVSVWLWALDYAEDGDLKGFGAAEIAAAAEWKGDSVAFVKALQDCRWLDKMRLHDWMKYAGRLVEKRVANRDRMREKRAKHVQRTTGARAGATIPNPTIPNPTLPAPSAKDEFWDPLKRIFAIDPRTVADEQRLYQQCQDFRLKGASVPEIERRSAIYRLRFPDVAFTAAAVLRQWEVCNEPPGAKPSEPARKKAQAL